MPQFPYRLLLWPLLLTPCLPAQETAPDPVPYRVEITLREPGAPAAQAVRRYTVLTGTKTRASYRLQQRVPYVAGPPEPGQAQRHYNWAERAINIDCIVTGAGASALVAVNLAIDITDLIRGEKEPEAGGPPPFPAQTRIAVDAPLALGARAKVASIDDPVLPRRYEIEVLVQRAP